MKIDALKEGMILKEDLISPFGDVLLKKGTALCNTHIKFMRNWGLTDIDVTYVDTRDSKNSIEAQLLLAANMLEFKFKTFSDNAHMMSVKSDIKKFINSRF